MPNLCFKTRKGSRTVQLVRHCYSPEIQRSRTVTLGSVPLNADPDDFRHALRLRPAVVLADDELVLIADWLRVHGDGDAARRRQEAVARIAARVREEVAAEMAGEAEDAFEQAVKALNAVTAALPVLAQAYGAQARMNLRPRYLAISAAADQLLRCAQTCGVAKTAKRRAKAPLNVASLD